MTSKDLGMLNVSSKINGKKESLRLCINQRMNKYSRAGTKEQEHWEQRPNKFELIFFHVYDKNQMFQRFLTNAIFSFLFFLQFLDVKSPSFKPDLK